jgi:ABC-type bacteriocin/lantibiotic exporter with double-glycine peptidase domain
MFKQWDPAWGDDALGGSGEKLRYVGCTVACVAMIFKFYGLETDPKRLNDWLKSRDGYTGQGLLKWDKCVEYAGGRVALEYVGEPDEPRMRRALAAGRPAIVKVLLEGGVNHWVLVVGTEGPDYLVNDPLNLDGGPARLSSYGRRVYALRIFRAVPRKIAVTTAAVGI